MSDRTGLGMLDVAILDALASVGAVPDGPYVKTQRVLDVLYDSAGIGPRIAHEPLCTMARPWVVHLLLVDFHGNVGSPDFEPASPRYTESRLAPLGLAALGAERAVRSPIPIGLVNGDLHVGGVRPPFDPSRVVAALRAVSAGAADRDLVDLVGRPSFPTGCDVELDVDAFVEGHETTLTTTAQLHIEGDRFVVTGLPPDASASELARSIAARVESAARWGDAAPGRLGRERPLPPIIGVDDDSTADETRLVLTAEAGTTTAAMRSFLATLWHFRRAFAVQLDRPLATVIREAAVVAGGEQIDEIERAIRHRA
ncbi:MAG: hypothetical protein NTZ21_06495 [Actinobacteria bacterium]|nr:hypothetical protein [Actinomycetota bacterium]